MGKPGPGAVVQVPLLRQHIGHPARLKGRQFLFLNRGLHTLINFISRFSRQYEFCHHEKDRQHRPRGRRIITIRAATPGVPKFGTVEFAHPSAFHDADKAVRAFNGSFIAILSEDHNCGVVGNGWRSRASSQGDFGIAVRNEVLVKRPHAGIWIIGILCLRVPGCTQGKAQRKESQSDHLGCLSLHLLFSLNSGDADLTYTRLLFPFARNPAHVPRNSSSAWLNSADFSICGTWPQCSNTRNLAPAMPSRSFSPLASGTNSSSRPHTTSVAA